MAVSRSSGSTATGQRSSSTDDPQFDRIPQQRAAHQGCDGFDPLSQVDVLHMRAVLPGERRRAREQCRGLIGCHERREQLPLQKGLILHLARDRIDVRADHHEPVVEIVHDAVPQPLHRFRLLRAPERLFVAANGAAGPEPASPRIGRPLPFGKGPRDPEPAISNECRASPCASSRADQNRAGCDASP